MTLGLSQWIASAFGQARPEPTAPARAPARPAAAGPDPVEEAERRAHLALLEGARACADNRLDAAIDHMNEAFVAFRQASDPRKAALAQKITALLMDRLPDVRAARERFRRARQALRMADLTSDEAALMVFHAEFEMARRETREAFRLFREARVVFRDAGDREGEADCLRRYAAAESSLGRVAEARALLEEAQALIGAEDTAAVA